MAWKSLTAQAFTSLMERELAHCSAEWRDFFAGVVVPAEKWSQSPWGDEGGGFWVIAIRCGHVLWYNDIEEGFNVSSFRDRGVIPRDQYWCNQDPLWVGLRRLSEIPERQTPCILH